jgi:hypothetical protein
MSQSQFCVFMSEGHVISDKTLESERADGLPLAVCINDCQLDYGQSDSELSRICFQVRCAFAEMRWGREAAELYQISSRSGEHS